MIHPSEKFVRVEATADLLRAIEKLLGANTQLSHDETCEMLALRLQILLSQHHSARRRTQCPA